MLQTCIPPAFPAKSPVRVSAKIVLLLIFLFSGLSPLLAQGPSAPSVSGARFVCLGSSVTLTANGSEEGSFAWYDAASGGSLLAATRIYTTPSITQGTHFYVEQTLAGETSERTDVFVVVNLIPNPAFPVDLVAQPSTICQGQTSLLSANVDTGAGHRVYWYDAPAGGNLLATSSNGTSFQVSPMATTTYYAQSEVEKIKEVFYFNGGIQQFVVPAGVTSINIDASGARGGYMYEVYGYGIAGLGGRVQATMSVIPGQVLYLVVGEHGYGRPNCTPCDRHVNSYNGGGNAYGAGDGGGATDIRVGGLELTNRVLVAGGGGGAGEFDTNGYGANGGGLEGAQGGTGTYGGIGGAGGTQSAGGLGVGGDGLVTQSGTFGRGGDAGYCSGNFGGGGGGGYYGGGGASCKGGGGGGSSYTDPTFFQNVQHTQGYSNDNGLITIQYLSGAECAGNTTRVPLTVSVNTTPNVTASANQITCTGTAVTLTSAGADTYTWSPENLTGDTVTVNPAQTTTYTVTGTLTDGGCTNTAQTTVYVTSVSAADQTICLHNNAGLSASGADNYTWEPGALSGNYVEVSPSATTVYTVTGHNASGCSTTHDVTVTVNPLPPVSAGLPQTVTAGTPVTLTATGADTYNWSPVQAYTSVLTLSPAVTTTFHVYGIYTATGCGASSSVLVTILSAPEVTGETTVCSGASTVLTATGTGPFTWYDAQTGGNLLHTGAQFATPALTANTIFWVSSNEGQRIPMSITVINPAANVTATPAIICPNGISSLTGGLPGGVTQWYDAPTDGNLLATTASGTPFQVTPAVTTTYYAQSVSATVQQTFYFNGGIQQFVVPAGVTSINIDASGARGGYMYEVYGYGIAGLGGRVQATMSVIPGQVLYLVVGEHGYGRPNCTPCDRHVNSYNGGGNAYGAGDGGGATDIRVGGLELTNRVLVAGGGGGAGEFDTNGYGANGGGLEGAQGGTGTYGGIGGAGGTQSAGGLGVGGDGLVTQSGTFGRGGDAGYCSGNFGGGGGGGYYGGGGASCKGGGGGGSSYTDPTFFQNVQHTQGYSNDNGLITISYFDTCESSIRVPVTVTVEPAFTISVNGPDSFCLGTPVTLSASGAETYNWTTLHTQRQSTLVAAGLHKINSAYNGAAIQLRRPSDNAVMDIGFNNMELDLAAANSFLGIETGYCVKLYDQSGSGNDFVQNNINSQPSLSLQGLNGKPTLHFIAGQSQFMTNSVNLPAPWTVIYAARQNGPSRGRMLSSPNSNWLLGWWGGYRGQAYYEGWVKYQGDAGNNLPYIYSGSGNGSTSAIYENGQLLASNGGGVAGPNGLQLNGWANNNNELSDADFADVYAYNEVLPDEVRSEIEQAAGNYYGILPTISAATFTVSPTGTTSYYVTGTSSAGCQSSLTKTLYLETQAPQVVCPGGLELILDSACNAILPDYRSQLNASDNCSPDSLLVILQVPAAGTTVSATGEMAITFIVTDPSGNTDSCTTTVLKKDNIAPVISCQQQIRIPVEPGLCGAHISFSVPSATDGCSVATVVQTAGPANGSFLPIGTSQVIFTATDASGNTTSCVTEVIVHSAVTVTAGNNPVCTGNTTTLTLTGFAGNISWYAEPNAQGIVLGSGNTLTGVAAGTYYAHFVSNCGAEDAGITITVASQPQIIITGDSLYCSGTRNLLTATAMGSVSWMPQTLPVDASPSSAQLAIGLRLLSSSYTGPLVRLRRAADDAELDFNAVGNSLDTAAVALWLNGADGYVVTLYDQSGSGNHITQSNAGSQPQYIIGEAGNKRPIMRCNTGQFMSLPSLNVAPPYSIIFAARETGGLRRRVLSSVYNNWLLGWWNDRKAIAYFEGWLAYNDVLSDDALTVYSSTSNGNAASVYENGNLISKASGYFAGPNGLQLNGFGGGELTDCEISDVIVYGSSLPDAARIKVESNLWNYQVASNQVFAIPDEMTPVIYTASAVNQGCSSTKSFTVRSAAIGDPTLYGTNQWLVYAWNSGTGTIGSQPWLTGYAGYYSAEGVSMDTRDQWNPYQSPSAAAGYQGCAVTADFHSWSAKRQGFPCDYYRISITGHEDAAQLWINGVLVWEHDGCCDEHYYVWQGHLGANDKIEFRGTDGNNASLGALVIEPLSNYFRINYPATSICNATTSLPVTIDGPSGGQFTATPSGLSIDAQTGTVNPLASTPGTYVVRYTFVNGCGNSADAEYTLNIMAGQGNPADFGTNTWNVYAWNFGTGYIIPGTWSDNYSGYYTVGGINFNTANQWGINGSPSDAEGYQGCAVSADQHSWSAKRQGFPCGYYRIDVANHDDAAQLWVNGVVVFEHNSCCDSHFGAWRGQLGATDRVEFRVTDGGGGSVGQLVFTEIPPNSISYAATDVCIGSSASLLPVLTGGGAGIYTASPSGLVMNMQSGSVDANSSAPGNYTISYTTSNGSCTLMAATTTLRIAQPLTVDQPANVTLCNGVESAEVVFSGAPLFDWTNSNPAIGLAASGSGPLPSFVTVNNSSAIQTATITVSPRIATISFDGHVSRDSDPIISPVNSTGYASTCGVEKPFPGYWYNAIVPYQVKSFVNTTQSAVCATIQYFSSYQDVNVVAYRGHFNSNDIQENYIGDGGNPVYYGASSGFAVNVAPGDTIELVIYCIYWNDAPYEILVSQTPACISPRSFEISVNPGATATIAYDAPAYCKQHTDVPVIFSGTTGGIYSSTPTGLSINTATGRLEPSSSIAGTYTVTYTATGGGSCGPISATTDVTVLETPSMNPAPNEVVCANTVVTINSFSGAFGYTWTNSNTSIGLAAGGTGVLPSFTAQNNTGLPIKARIVVTPWSDNDGSGCSGKSMVFEITVKPVPVVTVPVDAVYCAGAIVPASIFQSSLPNALFSWINTNNAIGLHSLGSGNIPAFTSVNNTGATQDATVLVTPIVAGCIGEGASYNISVLPGVGSISYPNSPYCRGGYVVPQRIGSSGGVYSSTPAGLVLNSLSGEINLALSAAGIYQVSYTVAAAGACTSVATTSVTIVAQVTVNALPNPVYCAGTTTPVIAFTGTAQSYAWTNSEPGIGLAASGTGTSLPSFLATNNTGSSLSGTIKITPLGGADCSPGKPISFRITVFPNVVVTAIANQVYCRGVSAGSLSFTSNLASGVSYAWRRTPAAIGLTALSGTVSIPAFTTQNPSASMLTSTVTVTGTANKCASQPMIFQYQVGNCVAGNSGSDGAPARISTGSFSGLILGPNPTDSRVTIQLEGKSVGNYSVQLLSADGSVLRKPDYFKGSSYTIDLTGLPGGAYRVQLTNIHSGEMVVRQVVKL
jgi:hypothetical protein